MRKLIRGPVSGHVAANNLAVVRQPLSMSDLVHSVLAARLMIPADLLYLDIVCACQHSIHRITLGETGRWDYRLRSGFTKERKPRPAVKDPPTDRRRITIELE